jgi:hypothetical protein
MTIEWSSLECQGEWGFVINGPHSQISLPSSRERSTEVNQPIDLFSIEVEGGATNA